MPEKLFAVIVGAGPAGLSCAMFLHRMRPDLAARTVVLEKRRHPRKKLCGGGINGKALPLLEELGIDLRHEGPDRLAAAGYDIRFQDRRAVFDEPGGTLIFDRPLLDDFLCKRAKATGIEIREDYPLKSLQVDRDGVLLQTTAGETLRAEAVVGADGVGSIVRRNAGITETYPRARLAQVELPLQNPAVRHLVFDFSPIPVGVSGYAWLFPEPGPEGPVAKIGIYDRTAKTRDRVNPRPILVEIARRWGYDFDPTRLDHYSIREWTPKGRFSAPRVLLAGDAAGADPLVAEGIHQALAYGKLAAEELIRAAEQRDFRFSDYTTRINGSPLGKELARNRLAARVLYSPLHKQGLAFGFRHPRILENVFAYVAGRAPEFADLGPAGVTGKALTHAAKKLVGLR